MPRIYRHMISTLARFAGDPGWHQYTNDVLTRNAVKRLEALGYLEVKYEIRGAKYTGKLI